MNNNDLALMLKGRTPLIALETYDELKALELLAKLRRGNFGSAWKWSITEGLAPLGFGVELKNPEDYCEPEAVLRHIRKEQGAQLFVLCDIHPFLDEPKIVRFLKDLALHARDKKQKFVLLSHSLDIPPELRRLSAKASISLPGKDEILAIVREEARRWQEKNRGLKIKTDTATLDKLVANLLGLAHQDVRSLAYGAIADDGAITESDLPGLTKAKFALMDMEGVLHFEYSTKHLSDVAGFDNLKAWLASREAAMAGFGEESHLDPLKGLLLFGVQGGGKSLAAKAIAGMWSLPLLRLDMAALFNKYIGETEKNLREALKLADLMSPCVLWVDEIEKGLAQDQENATGKRILGTLLTWMAERKTKVFLVATSNDISQLPPELMRKGRFDEIFFVDLPDAETRVAIFDIHLRKRGLENLQFDRQRLVDLSEGFTGAEIEQAVVSAMYSAAAEANEVSEEGLAMALQQTQPLSVLHAERVQGLRDWAADRSVKA